MIRHWIFLLKLMNDPNLSLELRVSIGCSLLPYTATSLRYKGVKAAKQEAADRDASDKYPVRRPPAKPWPYAQ
jgi:hypothetical protein